MPPCPRLLARALGAAFALALASCAPDVENVEVTATIVDASLAVEPSPFGSPTEPQGTPQGGFTVVLNLGNFASGSSDARVESLALVAASDQQLLIASLQVDNTVRTAHVEPATDQRLPYKLKYDKPQPIASLCAAKQVQYTGTVYDSASKKTKPISGPVITVGGCP